ncbi:MAG: hypothetical protein J2O47_01350 [Acidimicrobiaceae bacterium]|nr:hypothetical protein [Acidimicrobiaceae bacterium]
MSQQTTPSQQTQPFGTGSTSPAQQGNGSKPATNGQVQISDIKAKLKEIDSEVRGATEVDRGSKRTITVAAAAVVVGVVVLAFVLGRKRGRRTSTWVEVRRL